MWFWSAGNIFCSNTHEWSWYHTTMHSTVFSGWKANVSCLPPLVCFLNCMSRLIKYFLKSSRTRYTCFVPEYKNTSTKTPNKIFIHVPHDENVWKLWCEAVNCSNKKLGLSAHCCEDNFNVGKIVCLNTKCQKLELLLGETTL